MRRALGLSPHTGWAAAVVVGGSLKKPVIAAKRALAPLLALDVDVCAIVAKNDAPDALEHVLAAHPRIHTAEGRFYRDVLRDACTVPVRIIAPGSLDASTVGKLAGPPWGKDQKLAALAAWAALASM